MQVLFELTGTSPLIMNNARGIDKLDPLSKLIDELTHRSPRTEADDAEISHLEWLRCLYHDADIGMHVPAANIMRCLRNSGNLVQKNRGGKRIERGLSLTTDRIPLIYEGPRDLSELYQMDEFRLRGPAKIQNVRVMKTWPIFRQWSLQFEAQMSEEHLNFDDLVRFTEYAGQSEGLCDDRRHGRGRFLAQVAGGTTRHQILTGTKANGRNSAVSAARA